MNIRELLTEDQISIVLIALEQYEKKATSLANRSIQGYGKVSEYEKKEIWKRDAERIREVSSIIAEAVD